MKVNFALRLLTSLLVLTAMLVAGCSMSKLKGGTESSPAGAGNSSPKTATVFSPSNDARKDLRDALMKLNTAYPYRLTETTASAADGREIPQGTRVVEFAAADRSHMKWTGGPGGNVEAISIGDKHYWYSDGKWTAGELPGQRDRGADFAKKLAEMVKEVKYVGSESVNGVDCYAYTCTFEMPMAGQNWTGTARVWIGAGDGLPHQSDSEYKVANYGGKSHLVYEYNVNIKVEPPAI